MNINIFCGFSEGILLYGRYLNISDGNIPPTLTERGLFSGR